MIRPMFVTNERRWLVGGCWIFDGEKATARGVLNGRIVGVINDANLTCANLACANLTDANLTRANLTDAKIHEGASLPAGWVRGDSGIITRKP